MTDAKELVERERYLCGWMHNGGEWDQAVRRALSDNADWIERWAPVVEALTAYELLRQAYEHWEARGGRTYGPPPNSYQDRYMAKKRLRFAINAALGEDKP